MYGGVACVYDKWATLWVPRLEHNNNIQATTTTNIKQFIRFHSQGGAISIENRMYVFHWTHSQVPFPLKRRRREFHPQHVVQDSSDNNDNSNNRMLCVRMCVCTGLQTRMVILEQYAAFILTRFYIKGNELFTAIALE